MRADLEALEREVRDFAGSGRVPGHVAVGWADRLATLRAGVVVTDAMVERAAKRHMEVRGIGMHRAWESQTEETRHEYRLAMRAALTAALGRTDTGEG